MNDSIRIVWALAMLCVITGCATPSVHPLFSADKAVAEPTLAGTWKPKDEATTYTVTRTDDAYMVLMKTNDEDKKEEWKFEVRLLQLGKYRFADITALAKDRQDVGEKFGPAFFPTHLFVRYSLDGDTLTVFLLNRKWLERTLNDKKAVLAHTILSSEELLITAETPQLQEFVQAHADDTDAFRDQTELFRAKP